MRWSDRAAASICRRSGPADGGEAQHRRRRRQGLDRAGAGGRRLRRGHAQDVGAGPGPHRRHPRQARVDSRLPGRALGRRIHRRAARRRLRHRRPDRRHRAGRQGVVRAARRDRDHRERAAHLGLGDEQEDRRGQPGAGARREVRPRRVHENAGPGAGAGAIAGRHRHGQRRAHRGLRHRDGRAARSRRRQRPGDRRVPRGARRRRARRPPRAGGDAGGASGRARRRGRRRRARRGRWCGRYSTMDGRGRRCGRWSPRKAAIRRSSTIRPGCRGPATSRSSRHRRPARSPRWMPRRSGGRRCCWVPGGPGSATRWITPLASASWSDRATRSPTAHRSLELHHNGPAGLADARMPGQPRRSRSDRRRRRPALVLAWVHRDGETVPS